MTARLVLGTVHVWRADLDRETHLSAVLSPEERDRAARFRFEVDRLRWTRARSVLRHLLGSYLGREPDAIDFASGRHGKPALAGEEGIDFNLSHSGGTALLAFAIENPVGVDVEVAERSRDMLGVAARAFGRDELERLQALPPAEREGEFLRLWVRHEAALKCRGDRLGAPPKFDGLSMHDLEVGPGAAAAVALEHSVDAVMLRVFGP
jgi:4'-phosphopantetheinyl transferase